jgi:hypothetical protein
LLERRWWFEQSSHQLGSELGFIIQCVNMVPGYFNKILQWLDLSSAEQIHFMSKLELHRQAGKLPSRGLGYTSNESQNYIDICHDISSVVIQNRLEKEKHRRRHCHETESHSCLLLGFLIWSELISYSEALVPCHGTRPTATLAVPPSPLWRTTFVRASFSQPPAANIWMVCNTLVKLHARLLELLLQHCTCRWQCGKEHQEIWADVTDSWGYWNDKTVGEVIRV